MTGILALSAADWNALPFGAIRLDHDGVVLAYNDSEAALARRDSERTVGRNFFTQVAPCTQGPMFEGRFRAMMKARQPATETFDYDFKFVWGNRRVRIRLLVDRGQNGWIFVTPL